MSDENESNWMMFLKPARCEKTQNLIAHQLGRHIYFFTTKEVFCGQELLYWFSKEYATLSGTNGMFYWYYLYILKADYFKAIVCLYNCCHSPVYLANFLKMFWFSDFFLVLLCLFVWLSNCCTNLSFMVWKKNLTI